MRTVDKILDEYGFEFRFPADERRRERVKESLIYEGERGTVKTLAYLSQMSHLGVMIGIKDIVKVLNAFKLSPDLLSLPDVCFEDLRLLLAYSNNISRKQYPIDVQFNRTQGFAEFTKTVEKQIRKKPEAFGFKSKELKLKEIFGFEDEISKKAMEISVRYDFYISTKFKRLDSKKFEQELQNEINENGFSVEEILTNSK